MPVPLVVVVDDGLGASQRRVLSPPGPYTIGRDDEAALHVGDLRVSRIHATLVHDDGHWWFRDQSTSGSFADGQRVSSLPLEQPTTIRLADPASGPVVQLETTEATPEPQHTPTPSAQIRIGRGAGNDMVVPDLTASRHHAVLASTNTGWTITDLDSPNGTFVNGRPVRQAQLRNGDTITIGNTDLVFDDGELVVATERSWLSVRRLGYSLPGGVTLLDDVDLELSAGSLVAVIGPSGAGKSTLAKVLTSILTPTSGSVEYDGFDVHRDVHVVRTRIGYVPQDDIVHGKLSTRRALTYAARLRLPPDVDQHDADARVDDVLAELGLTPRADTRVDQLSGGQRKRVSTALELLTEPSLLILDEPTSGLDPGLDQQIMAGLRQIADSGRIVVVITHSPTNLDLCDQVLLLAPGGLPAYVGTSADLLRRADWSSWSEVFNAVSNDPAGAHAAYRADRQKQADRSARHSSVETRSTSSDPDQRWLRQARTLAARHCRLIVADRPYAAFLAVLPVMLALLAFAVPGGQGLRTPAIDAPTEPTQLLVVLIVGASFMGAAVSAREVIGERAILAREQMAGLAPWAYVGAKFTVFFAVCCVQALLLVGTVSIVKAMPASGVTVLPGAVEITMAVALTAYASCLLALWLSSMVKSAEQVMPILVITVMAQLVLCGGLIPVTGRAVLSVISWLAPSRWGYAASAATSDLRTLVPDGPQDPLWSHAPGWWLLSLAVLLVMASGFAVLTHRRVNTLSPSPR
ncbi:ATP-binding cassette domain-containing protein [Phytoactinopolyspora limicola]|uniref:ATP-binding cassette domain-containing protein n=1 Tax=Phytoactinopolyspora limicola TaxID=2715536 RepID=UPI0014077B91|nr:ATP-binding cassette domain-containing protein [Phytoactinopolyspora limicola]